MHTIKHQDKTVPLSPSLLAQGNYSLPIFYQCMLIFQEKFYVKLIKTLLSIPSFPDDQNQISERLNISLKVTQLGGGGIRI